MADIHIEDSYLNVVAQAAIQWFVPITGAILAIGALSWRWLVGGWLWSQMSTLRDDQRRALESRKEALEALRIEFSDKFTDFRGEFTRRMDAQDSAFHDLHTAVLVAMTRQGADKKCPPAP